MIFKLQTFNVQNDRRAVTIRCSACRQLGTFDAVNDQALCIPTRPPVFLGHRRCPNHTCLAHVFIAYDHEGKVLISYPPERIDFDSTSIPEPVVKSLEEAITCHVNGAFAAAAIMIRRTLEGLCADKNTQGKNLKERIAALGSGVQGHLSTRQSRGPP